MSNRRSAIKVNDADLLCKNGCGFFGNPSWHYYCSVCYRNVYLKKTYTAKPTQTEVNQSSVSSFTKFEEKRKAVATMGATTVKNIFKINKDFDEQNDNSDSIEAKEAFENFLSTLKKNAATDIMKQVKIHLDALEEAKFVKIEQHSVLVQKFYERLTGRLKNDIVYKCMSEDICEQLLEEVERYLSIQIYEWAFKPNFSDDEIKDLELQKRIRSLHWITPEILEAAIDEESPEEKVHFDDAITAMIEMNTKLCPKDKLDCIVRCCKSVFEMINAHNRSVVPNNSSNTRLVNADDFLPAIIFVLIRANPTLLHSNIQFIMRFSRPSLINSGENGYMFTNMSIAIEFINTLDHKALNMTENQFADAMKGIKPVKSLSDYDKNNVSPFKHDATFTAHKILEHNENLLQKLKEKEDVLMQNLIQLEDETKTYETYFFEKLDSIKQEVPLDFVVEYNGDLDHDLALYHKSRPSWDLIDSSIESSLPAPLLPNKTDLPSNKENWEVFLQ